MLGLGFAVGWVGSGRLGRRTSLSRYEVSIRKSAERFGVDPSLLRAIIRAESGGRPSVVSSRGAGGLMQLLPSTAREYAGQLGLEAEPDLEDPATNILLGACHLARLLGQFDHDTVLAVAAYNAGAGRVKSWLEKHPARSSREIIARSASVETRQYVGRVDRVFTQQNGGGL